MKTATRPLEEVVRELPPDLRDEVRDFAEFLLSKQARRRGRTLRQDWAGYYATIAKNTRRWNSSARLCSGEVTDVPRGY